MRNALVLWFFLVFVHLNAQQRSAASPGEGFALRAFLLNQDFPQTSVLLRKDFSFGYEFGYLYQLGKSLDVAFPLRMGEVFYPIKGTGARDKETYLGGDVQFLLRYYTPEAGFNAALLFGAGYHTSGFNKGGFRVPLGAALDLRLTKGLTFSTQLEYRLGLKENPDQLLLSAGIKMRAPARYKGNVPNRSDGPSADRDRDGTPDASDTCPDTPGPSTTSGCPDTDGDGIPDLRDACPDMAGPVQGCPDADGDGIADKEDACPLESGPASRKGCPDRDQDGDGVPDKEDRCPTEAGPTRASGCPDQDGDGIPDTSDDCPELAGSAQTAGCPDTDSDGVADKSDKCPYTPGPPLRGGCPEVDKSDQNLLDSARYAVQFLPGSATLRPPSMPILDKVVDIMRKYPDFKLRIQAHTDDVGTAENNLRLSENRARTCYDYLVSKGIGPRRLSWEGLGETRPLGDNKTAEGREKNRRVEFLLDF